MPGEMATRRGRIRPALTITVGLLALIAVDRVGLPESARLAAAVGVVLGVSVSLLSRRRHTIRLQPGRPAAIDGVAGVLRARAATPLFVSLELSTPGGETARVGLFRDELPDESFRELLAYLRHG